MLFVQASLSSNSSSGERPVLMTHKQLVDPFASDDEEDPTSPAGPQEQQPTRFGKLVKATQYYRFFFYE